MKRLIITLGVVACITTPTCGQSKVQNFDFGWKFIEQDVKEAHLPSCNDGKWTRVNLPHDWDIYHSPKADAPTANGGGYYPGGIGWYRKQVRDTDLKTGKGESLWLHFEGIYQNSQVFVNGIQVGTHFYGYTPFKVKISPYIKKGINTIAVRVDNSKQPNCRWYSGSGIYRHVWLEKYHENKMDAPQQLFIQTEKIYGMSKDGTHADSAAIRKVRLMKEAGFNLIRTSHNPQTRAMLDACDSLGMMVIDEAYDGWYTEKTKYDYHLAIDSCYQEDLKAMVLRDRNHPCIISYSIGNEVIERKEIKVIQTAQKFKKVITSLDNTRPVTEALCSWDHDWEIFDPHAAVLDIVGYNYMMHKAESDHERCPERVMWQTESYPRDAFANWKHTVERPYIIGDMVWTGLDYLGESAIGQFHYEGESRKEHYQENHYPYHGAYCGDVDLTGWRKPISHYRSMLWNLKDGSPDIYLAVKEPDFYYKGHISETQWSVWPTWESWNWQGWEGRNIDVEIYSKSPRVRLYLNDQLVAEKQVGIDTEYKAVITLPYQPGVLKAVSLDANRQEVKESILQTSGELASIKLTADRKHILASGEDLAYITLEVIDKNGNIVPDANIPLNVDVKGRATLLAAASANLKDLEPKTSSKVTTYKGRAIVVIRSGNKPGKATVTVSSSKFDKTISETIFVR